MTLHTLGTPKPGKYDPNLAERLNKEAEEEARRSAAAIKSRKTKPTAIQTNPEPKAAIEYKNLVTESDRNMRNCWYNLSLERVKAAGYDRHIHLDEVMAMQIDFLDGKVDPMRQIFLAEMRRHREWLGLAFERDRAWLITYVDPEGLDYDMRHNAYIKKPDFKCSEELRWKLRVEGFPHDWSGKWLRMDQLGHALGSHLIGREYAELPKQLSASNIFIKLPENGDIWPACFDLSDYHIHADTVKSGSRGVRMKQ
ncbi:hypothetical protein HY642_03780 [Candidatus Woesearchaeota archaeon]|nr:hypothetical protein [Candidatus Woesearchaeota archaeon]